MRQYKFDKPLVESSTPPRSTDVYWVDVDETTHKLATIKEFDRESGNWQTTIRNKNCYEVAISVEDPGIKLVCDKSFYFGGETVILTAVLSEGQKLDISADWAGGDIDLEDESDTSWSFEMPNGDVAVYAAEAKIPVIKFKMAYNMAASKGCSCPNGSVEINKTLNGQPVTETYPQGTTSVSWEHDAGTEFVIKGNFYTDGTAFRASGDAYSEFDVSSDTMTVVSIGNEYLTTANIGDSKSISELVLSFGNPKLAQLTIGNLPNLAKISCNYGHPQEVCEAIAGAITNSTVASGTLTLYRGGSGTSSSIMEAAATAKGWEVKKY